MYREKNIIILVEHFSHSNGDGLYSYITLLKEILADGHFSNLNRGKNSTEPSNPPKFHSLIWHSIGFEKSKVKSGKIYVFTVIILI